MLTCSFGRFILLTASKSYIHCSFFQCKMSWWQLSVWNVSVWSINFAFPHIKGALCSFGGETLMRRESSSLTSLSLKKRNKLYLFPWLNKLVLLILKKTQFHTLCLHLADPATSLASDHVLGTFFPSENSLFIQLWGKKIHYYLLDCKY